MQEKKSGLASKLEKWLKARHAKKEILPEDQVHLSDFMGLKPGVYLTCIYSFVLIVILFFVLVFPGIRNPGSVIIFETIPSGAALRVDGLYMGTSPGKIFVPKGTHQLEVILPDFEPKTIESEIPGRLFASVSFPRRYPLKVELECPAPVTVVRDAARDFADWTFGGEPTADWQIPLSLSEGIYRVGNNGNRASIADVLAAAARFGSTRAALRDLSRAKALSDNGGLSPSPVSLYHSATDVLRFLSENPRSAEWLGSVLPLDVAVIVTKSDWYKKNTPPTDAVISISNDPVETLPRDRLSLAGLSFTGVSGGVEKPFLICDTPVTVDAYNLFVAAHTFWAAESIEMIVENGLAATNYLQDDRPDKAKEGTENIQTAISWFAAVDFCEWLTGRLPAVMSNYEVRLPRESEWEIAPRVPTKLGTASDLWEWCADPYAPVNSLHAKTNYIDWLGSLERSLRGYPVETRTSLPANFCSAFVSFRPVIALKENR